MEGITQWHDMVESAIRDYHIYDIHSQKVTQISLIFCSAEELWFRNLVTFTVDSED